MLSRTTTHDRAGARPRPVVPAPGIAGCSPARARPWLASVLLSLVLAERARAEDHLDYKFEDYDELHGRVQVRTHSALFEKSLGNRVTARGELVYDSISGATPTGGPAQPGSHQVPLAQMEDIRRAGNVALDVLWGIHRTTPQVAYSVESDYESVGLSLNHAIELNEKNTTIQAGVAYTWDTIMPEFWRSRDHKDSLDVLLGVTQLLGPQTVLSVNLTLGTAAGYMADPYRGFRFDDYPDPEALFEERRPQHKTKQVALASLTQRVEPLRGSAEVSYRFYHDSFGIVGHTATAEWFQNVGRHLIVAPMFRYYRQSAADFYAVSRRGDPTIPPDDPFFPGYYIPEFYSADYRLSEFSSFTYGVGLTVLLGRHVYLDAAYKRYEMRGEDHVTSASAYPRANVATLGLRLWF